MKWTRQLTTAVMAVTVMLSPALAATGNREDNSNFLVWAFLGICGLIIFLQLVPVFSLAFGFFKGLTGAEEKDELETVTSKYR